MKYKGELFCNKSLTKFVAIFSSVVVDIVKSYTVLLLIEVVMTYNYSNSTMFITHNYYVHQTQFKLKFRVHYFLTKY